MMRKIIVLLLIIGCVFIIMSQTMDYEGKYIGDERFYIENENFSVHQYVFLKDEDTLKIRLQRPIIYFKGQFTTIKNFDILGNNIFLEKDRYYKMILEKVNIPDTIFYPYYNNGNYYFFDLDTISYPINNITYGRYITINNSQYYIKQLFVKEGNMYKELHPMHQH